MTIAAAITTTKPRDTRDALHLTERPRPVVFETTRDVAAPSAYRGYCCPEIVNVPVIPLGLAKVPSNASSHSARPEGTADIDIVSRRHKKPAPTADFHLSAHTTAQNQRICPGQRFPLGTFKSVALQRSRGRLWPVPLGAPLELRLRTKPLCALQRLEASHCGSITPNDATSISPASDRVLPIAVAKAAATAPCSAVSLITTAFFHRQS